MRRASRACPIVTYTLPYPPARDPRRRASRSIRPLALSQGFDDLDAVAAARRSRGLAEQDDAVGVGAEAVVLDAPDVGGLGEVQRWE